MEQVPGGQNSLLRASRAAPGVREQCAPIPGTASADSTTETRLQHTSTQQYRFLQEQRCETLIADRGSFSCRLKRISPHVENGSATRQAVSAVEEDSDAPEALTELESIIIIILIGRVILSERISFVEPRTQQRDSTHGTRSFQRSIAVRARPGATALAEKRHVGLTWSIYLYMAVTLYGRLYSRPDRRGWLTRSILHGHSRS